MRMAGKWLVAALAVCCAAAAGPSDWQNLAALKPGQRIEVRTASANLAGEFAGFDAQAIRVRVGKQDERSLAQAGVTRVALAKRGRAIWLGAIVGAGGGLLVGAGLASRLANESGGDFSNLKPAITGGCGAAGALIGAGIGAAVRQGTVIYQQ